MKKSVLLIVLLCSALTLLAANPGATCATAIPVGKDFKATITGPQTVWYYAWTFDLPLSVMFAPAKGASDAAPEVELDFSCISGYYEDEILCSLFCRTGGNSGLNVKMPYTATLDSKTLDDGTFVYYMQLGERYRNLLLQMGISYNVRVFVKVTFRSAGDVSIAPDDLFTNCMDGPKFMQIGDTVEVKANDKNRHVIVPYVQWQEDTILYTWTGTKPCQLTVTTTCDFDPTDPEQELVQFNQIQPGETLKVKAENIYQWVHNKDFPPQAGMYFAKFYSEEEGVMKVTKAEQAPPEGGAVLMRFGTSYALDANSQAVYAIPRSWQVDVLFTTPTVHLFSMEFSKTASFNEADILASYTYKLGADGRWAGIPDAEMAAIWSKVSGGQQYIYVRFICTEATSITGDRWAVSQCYKNTDNYTIAPEDSKTIGRTSSQVYRFSYPQWKGGDLTINFSLTSNCFVYFADTCGMNTSKKDADYWLVYKDTIKGQTPFVIPAEKIASWADQIDEEGSFYGLFYTSANGTRKLTFTTNAPAEVDPVYPAATIVVACNEEKQPFVKVSEAQTITIKNEAGTVVKTIADAQPDTQYFLSELPVGKYTLEGKNEKIIVNL